MADRVRLAMLLLALLTPLAAAAEVPLVVAVDGSRSLAPADAAAVAAAVADLLRTLPPGAPVGLLQFADDTRWLAPGGSDPEAAAHAVQTLTPGGRWTLLHDGLVVAIRALPDGGVVVLLSDGRDENSATTVEDVSRLAEAAGVRVLTAAVGARIDERALRRLALVTGGTYLGRLEQLAPAELQRGVAEAIAAVEALTVPGSPAPEPVAASTAPPPSAAEVPEHGARRLPGWLAALMGCGLLATGAAAALLIRRRLAASRRRRCAACGATLEAWEEDCSRCQIAELEEAQKAQEADAPEPYAYETMVDRSSPIHAGLDVTMVLDERPVLVVRRAGQPEHTVPLSFDRVLTGGRASDVNTLVLDDPTVSARHFKIVPKDRQFHVVDLETTNGTRVNGERVRVRALRSGDVLRAGAVELEFQVAVRRVG